MTTKAIVLTTIGCVMWLYLFSYYCAEILSVKNKFSQTTWIEVPTQLIAMLFIVGLCVAIPIIVQKLDKFLSKK